MCTKRSIFINGTLVVTSGILCFFIFPRSVIAQDNLYVKILINCVGFFVVLLGQFLRISARGYKSCPYNAKAKLITDGPYSIVRNPMYLGSFFIGLGTFTIMFPWWVIPIYSVLFFLWYRYQIRGEQQYLKNKFSDQYIDYCRQVPCFFPKPSSFFKRTFFRAFPFRFGWIKKEWNLITTWVLLIVIHESYMNIVSYPSVFFIAEIIAFITILVITLSLVKILCKPFCLC